MFGHFDFKMLANIVQKNHKNSDFHWITHYSIFNGVSSAGLDDTKPFTNSKYFYFSTDGIHVH